MSTRDEILEALSDNPEGLTSKELAPLCPAGDCDPMIVGRMIAALRAENVIHPADHLREGNTIWIFGKSPRPISREPSITLPEGGRASAPVSEAARAIAAMRAPAQGVKQKAEPPAPPAVQHIREEKKENDMTTIREKIESALREHGPMTSRELGEHVKAEGLGQHCFELAEREVLKRLGSNGPRSTIYGLPGQKLTDHVAADTPHQAPKPLKEKKARKVAKPAKPRAAPTAPVRREPAARPANGAAQFAINEHGELGIETSEAKLRLDAGAFERLRDFISRTESVWKEAA